MIVAAVILAAGRGTRLGGRKLELPWRDHPTVLDATLATYASLADSVVVVLGHEAARLRPIAERHGAQVAINTHYDAGMLSSVQCGLGAVGEVDAVWLTPGDLPDVQPATVATLRAAWQPGDGLVIPICGDRRGHPLMLAADLIATVSELDPEVGLRQLRQRVPDRVRLLPVDDPGILTDLDTPDDYLRSQHNRNI